MQPAMEGTGIIAGGSIAVKGPLGSMARAADPNVEVKQEGEQVLFKALGNSNHANAMSGTMRALVANMVLGVTKGFEKRLALVGVGFRAQAQGDKLNLSLGFSHPVVHQMPKGVKVATPTQTEIIISGIDKQLVGQVAAEVRAHRSPEPYKGKGVRYANEVIVLKETKKK
ncbi:MAG TPA: 50S ribosomal protein L6 [Burkholderiales bacterium]|nr:50S ribosomal protein L6 [Burkholderiales bacterium]